MEISLRDLGKSKILQVNGDVDLYNWGELKKAIFEQLEDDSVKSLVVDMKGIEYMDSSGIGALVSGRKKAKTAGKEFGLVNINDDVMNILRLATLDQFFKIYENENQIGS